MTIRPPIKTVLEIQPRLSAIASAVDDERDAEKAHGLEDELWHDVLIAIAAGAFHARALAGEALKSREIAFPRHYA